MMMAMTMAIEIGESGAPVFASGLVAVAQFVIEISLDHHSTLMTGRAVSPLEISASVGLFITYLVWQASERASKLQGASSQSGQAGF